MVEINAESANCSLTIQIYIHPYNVKYKLYNNVSNLAENIALYHIKTMVQLTLSQQEYTCSTLHKTLLAGRITEMCLIYFANAQFVLGSPDCVDTKTGYKLKHCNLL